MIPEKLTTFCRCFTGKKAKCRHKGNCFAPARPLHTSKKCCKVRVCKITGDRKNCARMADLGVLPGSELELLDTCKHRKNCMVKINGGTLSLDESTAKNIFVQPA